MCNKVILAICAAAISITLVSCAATKPVSKTDSVVPSSLEKIPVADNVKVVPASGDKLFDPKTLEEVEDLSDYIVRGHLLDDAKQKLERYGSAPVIFGVTVSSFEISKVYKGNLKEGDKIPIAESYYTLEENGKTTRYELDYTPSIPGQEYIFFLINEDEKLKVKDENYFLHGFYSLMVDETGRYAVITPKDSNFSKRGLMSANELNHVKTDREIYQKIYNQVIDKYMK